jgi:hypothetical protein
VSVRKYLCLLQLRYSYVLENRLRTIGRRRARRADISAVGGASDVCSDFPRTRQRAAAPICYKLQRM